MTEQHIPSNPTELDSAVPEQKITIGKTIEIEGEVSAREHISIEGRLQGKISCDQKDVFVERHAVVKADIHAKNTRIRGHVEGNVYAAEKVHIEKDGHMDGDICASRISIDDGAQFKGSVKIVKPTTSSP